MRCEILYETLVDISLGESPRHDVISEVLKMGFAVKVEGRSNAEDELASLKEKLNTVKEQLKEITGSGGSTSNYTSSEIAGLKKELPGKEIELRRRILALVQSMPPQDALDTHEGKIALTYKGREALRTLSLRIESVKGMEWEAFASKIDALRSRLSSEAKEASRILKIISPHLKSISEHHLRSAAVGLASLDGEPETKAKKFVEYAGSFQDKRTFDSEFVALGSEIALASETESGWGASEIVADFDSFMSSAGMEITKDLNYRNMMASLLLPLKKSERSSIIQRIHYERSEIGNDFATALLLVDNPNEERLKEIKTKFAEWKSRIVPGTGLESVIDKTIACALLATAKGNSAAMEEKFDKANFFMRQLFEEEMYTASANIALWSTGVEESFDNIRLGSSEILLNKLSLGGVENFSLGIKLLSNNREFASFGKSIKAEPVPVGTGHDHLATGLKVGGAIAIPVAAALLLASPLLARVPFTIYHAVTLQKSAERDFRYHPVHTNYLYG